MIEALIAMSQKNLDYANRLAADLPPEKMAAQPSGVTGKPMNHAAWVLGHLAFVADFYATVLGGGQPTSPKHWSDLFGMNSAPQPDASKYPAKDDLLRALAAGHDRLIAVVRAKPADFWSQPVADEKRRARFANNTALAVHMLVNHDAIHLGQLSAWRRALGLPSV